MATYRPIVQMGVDMGGLQSSDAWVFRDGAVFVAPHWAPRSQAARGSYGPSHWASRALGPDSGKDVGVFVRTIVPS